MRLLLAPMEGVVDWVLRDTMTELGGIDQCVTEFVRVTTTLHPKIIFSRSCPELQTGSKTRSGTPVFVQLLGGQPEPMAANAARAAELGAAGIDINFGCPAKLVNRHDGGAVLLKSPNRVFEITRAVRAAVPAEIPVTAKIRLGFDDPSKCLENAIAAEEAGAHWLTVHCRTKVDGYKPPAYWEWIPRMREKVKLPIIANGEVWSVEDYWRCREVSQSCDVMIGRGAIARPFLFREIQRSRALKSVTPQLNFEEKKNWPEIRPLLPKFFLASKDFKSPWFAQARTKQWLRQLSIQHPEAKPLFDEIKVIHQPQKFESELARLTV